MEAILLIPSLAVGTYMVRHANTDLQSFYLDDLKDETELNIIESGVGDSTLVKKHHNIGGLPDVIDFEEIIEPLRFLFKNEVRKAGLELGIDEALV